MRRLRLLRLFVPSIVLAASGCIHKQVENDTTTFTFEWWVAALFIVGGLIVSAIGIYIISTKKRFRGALAVLVGIIAIVVGPGFFTEYATISDNELAATKGSWLTRSVVKVPFDEVDDVRVSVSARWRRFRSTNNYVLVFTMKERGAQQLALEGLTQAALPDIVAQLKRRNIDIRGYDQLPNEMK